MKEGSNPPSFLSVLDTYCLNQGYLLLLSLSKDNPFTHNEVDSTRNTKSRKVAYHHTPSKEMLQKQQEHHLDTKGTCRRKVIIKIFISKPDSLALFHTIAPHKMPRAYKIGKYSTFERQNGRHYILPGIGHKDIM